MATGVRLPQDIVQPDLTTDVLKALDIDVQVNHRNGAAAVVYVDEGLTGVLSASGLVRSENGRLPGYVPEGSYDLEVAGMSEPYRFEAVSGASAVAVETIVQAVGAAFDAAQIQAAISASGRKKVRLAQDSTFVINATIQNPSGGTIEGGGTGSTFLTPDSGFAGPMIECAQFGGSANEFALGWRQGLKNFTIVGNTTHGNMPAAITDDRQVCDGIYIHDSDWVDVEDVTVAWMAGYAIKIGPYAREGKYTNFRAYRCGNASTTKAAVIWTNTVTPADQNNENTWINLRVIWPHYIGVHLDAQGDALPGIHGSYISRFIGGQIEAGGWSGTGTTMQTSATAWNYDLVKLENCKDIYFSQLELGGNWNSGSPGALINCVGATQKVQFLGISGCTIANNGYGPGINADQVSNVSVGAGTFGYCSSNGQVITTSTNTGLCFVSADAVIIGSTGTNGAGISDSNNKVRRGLLDPKGGTSVPTRAMGTAYQPNANRPTLVTVSFSLSPGSGVTLAATVLMDAANPPTTQLTQVMLNPAAAGFNGWIPVTFVVPASHYYKFVQTAGAPIINSIVEQTL